MSTICNPSAWSACVVLKVAVEIVAAVVQVAVVWVAVEVAVNTTSSSIRTSRRLRMLLSSAVAASSLTR